MILSERVRSALCDDLRDMVRGLERMGLWVRVGDQVGRVKVEDLALESAATEGRQNARGPNGGQDQASQGYARQVARGPRKAQASARSKAKGPARLALPAPKDGAAPLGCDVCAAWLEPSTRRSKNLCLQHAGRWSAAEGWARKNGNPAPDYDAWVANQKAGGGRIKKA